MKGINCKEAVEFILRKEEGKLSLWNRFKLSRHLAICSLCRIFAVQSKHINVVAKNRKEKQLTLSADEKERMIQKALNAES